MASLCKVTIIGRLGRDPETRYTPSGKPLCAFSVAADSGWGENKETVWFRVTLWGERATKLSEYLHKGSQVYIEGNLRTRTWEGQDGQKRTDLEVTATELVMLDRKQEQGDGEQGGGDDGIPF